MSKKKSVRKSQAQTDPDMDVKAARFFRVAGKRAGRAINALDSLVGCTNPSNYYFTEEQATKILNALQASMDRVRKAFESPQASGPSTFEL